MTQPARPANASDAPMTLTNFRRLRLSSHSSISCGYSRETNSANSGASTNSSTLRQYSLPSCANIRSRMIAKFCLCSGLGILSMTGRAACHHLLASDLVIGLHLLALVLVGIGVLPLHTEYLGLWPDELLRSTMARDAPLHLQRVLLENSRHIVDLPVTRGTADAL